MEDTAMKSRYTRILSVLLCAALACSILAGCSTAASSSEAPSSASSSASSAASGEDLPDSTTRADTSGLNPGDFDENSIFSITGTSAAFEPCLGWGPGVSGCSLKSVIAAASLLQWAEDARLASRTPDAVQEAFYNCGIRPSSAHTGGCPCRSFRPDPAWPSTRCWGWNP